LEADEMSVLKRYGKNEVHPCKKLRLEISEQCPSVRTTGEYPKYRTKEPCIPNDTRLDCAKRTRQLPEEKSTSGRSHKDDENRSPWPKAKRKDGIYVALYGPDTLSFLVR
jgi:hypothetical protein